MPGIRWQACFTAGLLQEGRAIPAMLERNLRQKQAAISVLADEQSMLADFDVFGSNRAKP